MITEIFWQTLWCNKWRSVFDIVSSGGGGTALPKGHLFRRPWGLWGPPSMPIKFLAFVLTTIMVSKKTFHLIVVIFFQFGNLWMLLNVTNLSHFFFQKPDQTTHSKFLLRFLNNKNEFFYYTRLKNCRNGIQNYRFKQDVLLFKKSLFT